MEMLSAVTYYETDLLWGPLESLQIEKRLHLTKLLKAGWEEEDVLKLLQTEKYKSRPCVLHVSNKKEGSLINKARDQLPAASVY